MKFILLVVWLVVPFVGRGEEAAPDFSEGFRKLVGLGLPELDAKARWVRMEDDFGTDYRLREMAEDMKGGGWYFEGPDGKPHQLGMGVAVGKEAEGSKAPSEQDLEKDVAKLLVALEKKAKSLDREDRFSSSYELQGLGRLLIFAAQLHQNGRTDLANQVALATFAVYPTREEAVDVAVDGVASDLYQEAAAEFFLKPDWKTYHDELSSLVERFPRGWDARGAVAMMLPQLAKQAAGGTLPVPSLPDVEIDPRALELIASFDKPDIAGEVDEEMEDYPPEIRARILMSGGGYGFMGRTQGLWLLEDAEGETDSGPPMQRLARLGMDALPALAALAGDPWFTVIPNPGSSSNYFSSDMSGEELTLRSYQSLNRPATRGEIAMRMLAATLPDAGDDLDEADAETLRDLALEFWKNHHGKSREELAAVFLREGSSSQVTQAATVLASSKDPAAHEAFEAYVLGSDPALAAFQAVQVYVKGRRAAAKDFVTKYKALVHDQTPEGKTEGIDHQVRWMVERAGSLDKFLKPLDMLIEAQSPRSFAVQLAKGPADEVDAGLTALWAMLEDGSAKKKLYAFLEGASAAEDAEVRGKFLARSFRIGWAGEEGDEEPAERALSASEKRVWRKFIDDTRETSNLAPRLTSGEKSTVSALAAAALEYSVAPDDFEEVYQQAGAIGRPAGDVICERASLRLDGKPVPPLPDASKISSERLASIVSEAGAKKAEEIHPFLDTLTPDERAAWTEWLRDPGELEMPSSVVALQSYVIRRQSEPTYGLEDTPGAGGMDVDEQVNRENFDRWLETTAADVVKHSRTYVILMPADFGPGLTLMTPVLPLPKEPADEEEEDEAGERTR
ncbi:MAG: hypothetical protein KDN05_15170, partial [Verrucomicrobiae bacterium]|nr:hypothetical protein [Verrucomicrobiae bacterium]